MLMSVAEFRAHVDSSDSDAIIINKLSAIEHMIRKYTNNNFQKRACRRTADIVSGSFMCDTSVFAEEDTIQVSRSAYNDGLYTITEIIGGKIDVLEDVADEKGVLITKVCYPVDVKLGAINMLKWDIKNRSKVGIQSESISRHSVTYFNMDGDNSALGYPKSLIGFLTPYKKARF